MKTQHCRNTGTLAAVLAEATFVLFLKLNHTLFEKGFQILLMIEVIITSSTDNNCHFCHRVFCRQCKETHVIDLDTKYHHVTLYEKKNHRQKIIQTIRTKYMNAIVNCVNFQAASIAISTKLIN